jgi:hypothetical protein
MTCIDRAFYNGQKTNGMTAFGAGRFPTVSHAIIVHPRRRTGATAGRVTAARTRLVGAGWLLPVAWIGSSAWVGSFA